MGNHHYLPRQGCFLTSTHCKRHSHQHRQQKLTQVLFYYWSLGHFCQTTHHRVPPYQRERERERERERAYVDTIASQLYKLLWCQTQTSQRSINLQVKVAKTKRMKDSVILAQTKDMIQTSRVLLLSMEAYQGAYSTVDNIPFSN